MSRQLLLDGYNILKQAPEFAGALDRSLEEGRNALVRFIRDRRPQGSGRNGITVVFDGQAGMASVDGLSAAVMDVRVIFTHGSSADDYMRACVEDAPDPGRIICVTNDRDLAIACRRCGAVIWNVDEFMAAGYKQETLASRRLAESRRREGDGKAISHVAARQIDQELAQRWLNGKG